MSATPAFGLAILYVDDPAASAAFYADLLARPPTEASPTFAMFSQPSGAGLALWSRQEVAPVPAAGGGGSELAFIAGDVDALHADWSGRGVTIAQPPIDLSFGRSFVALDPDGHRLRVFKPGRA